MTGHRITLKGVRVKDGKVQRIPYGSASAKIKQRKSKKPKVVRRQPG